MKRFKLPRRAQRFLSVHARINNLSHLRRHCLPAAQYRTARTRAFQTIAGGDLPEKKDGEAVPGRSDRRCPPGVNLSAPDTGRGPHRAHGPSS